MTGAVTCTEFDTAVDDLAVGALPEPGRSRLLAHAAGCPRCADELAGLAAVVDRLLLLAPRIEPPAGFESRLLAPVTAGWAGSRTRPRRSGRLRLAAAAAAALLVAGLGYGIGRATGATGGPPAGPARVVAGAGKATPAIRRGTVVTTSGQAVGDVEVVALPRPHVLLAVDRLDAAGAAWCQLDLPDGRSVTVGSWTYGDLRGGVWAVGIDPSLLGATAMEVRDANGAVLARATLS